MAPSGNNYTYGTPLLPYLNDTGSNPPIFPLLHDNETDSKGIPKCRKVAPWAAHYVRLWDTMEDNNLTRNNSDYNQMNIEFTMRFLEVVNDGYGYSEQGLIMKYASEWLPKTIFDIGSTDGLANYYYNSADNISLSCKPEFCRALGYPGDPDVVGQGAILSYSFLVGLTTLFFGALLIIPTLLAIVTKLRLPLTKSTHEAISKFVLRPFQNTVEIFLDTALVFVIAMLFATIVRFGSLKMDHLDLEASPLNFRIGLYFALLCAYPPVVLFLVSNQPRRRDERDNRNYGEEQKRTSIGHHTRRALWAVALVLILTCFGIWKGAEYDTPEKNAKTQSQKEARFDYVTYKVWDDFCEGHASLRDWMMTVNLCVFSVYSLGYSIYLLRHCFSCGYHYAAQWFYDMRKSGRARKCQFRPIDNEPEGGLSDEKAINRKMRKRMSLWRGGLLIGIFLLGTLCMVLMWATFAIGEVYRRRISAKVSDPLNNWTFGQVLSLATWASVILVLLLEYLHILIPDPTSRLVRLWKRECRQQKRRPKQEDPRDEQQALPQDDSADTASETTVTEEQPPPKPARPNTQSAGAARSSLIP